MFQRKYHNKIFKIFYTEWSGNHDISKLTRCFNKSQTCQVNYNFNAEIIKEG